MGIYDRDYERADDRYGEYGRPPGLRLAPPRTLVGQIIVVTVALYFVQILLGEPYERLFALHDDWWREPWKVFQLVTYGFLHSPQSASHVAFNMLGLYFFGREVERMRGYREFALFYLAAIALGGIVWTLLELPGDGRSIVIGASGAVVACTIYCALYFPNRIVLLFMVIPVPLWLVGTLIVLLDLHGAITQNGVTACTVHLTGAAFAYLYVTYGWRLEDWLPFSGRLPSFKRRPKLRVLVDDDEDETDTLEAQMDKILDKIKEKGQASLTRQERRILEEASKKFRDRTNR